MGSPINEAAWLPGVGQSIKVGPSELPRAGDGELVIETKAVAVQPAEWKLQKAVLKFPLDYPTVLGIAISGIVHEVGPGVTRFQKGDRVVSNTAGSLRNDSRFGGYQKYSLTTESLTSKIMDTSFERAVATVSNIYGAIGALTMHLGLERPGKVPNPANKSKKILIWGASSSFGLLAAQLAVRAGYTVVGVASAHNAGLVRSAGVSSFVDRKSESVADILIQEGPYVAVLAANDAAADQPIMGEVLKAQGGGSFLSTMGLRPGVVLPEGVQGLFAQYLDDYLDPKNSEFTKWVWWDYIEETLQADDLVLPEIDVIGGLSKVQEAWDLLSSGKVSGRRLIIKPELD